MTGWEIRQALAVILSHDDTTIEAGLAWLPAADIARLAALARKMESK